MNSKGYLQESIELLLKHYSNDYDGEEKGYAYETVGVIVSCDDPLEMGRMQIFCPAYNDDPKQLDNLPWTIYSTPFAGTIDNSEFTRGNDNPATTSGGVAYGQFGSPEIGAHALVSCLDGDIRRRVFKGCVFEHQNINTIGHGRYKHENGEVDGPLSSTGERIEPLYSNYDEAFGDKSSAEWKTRGVDYQAFSLKELPTKDSILQVDSNLDEIKQNEQDAWVKEILGDNGYDWTGYKGIGSLLINRVYGMTTPGFHSITMDDRHFNSRTRIRSTSGHQIILDDTNERIYISTSKGNSWIEMDSYGIVDYYCKSFNVHAEDDINFSAKRVRMKGENIYMYAGNETGQAGLAEVPPIGEIRVQTQNDLHTMVGGNKRTLINENHYLEITGDNHTNQDNLYLLGLTNLYTKFNETYIRNSTSNIEVKDNTMTFNHNAIISFESGKIVGETSSGAFELDSSGLKLKGDAIDFSYTAYDKLGLASIVTAVNANSSEHSRPALPNEGSTNINAEELDLVNIDLVTSNTSLAPWTNRVPQHEPWARNVKIDSAEEQNISTNRYLYNVDWVDQYDNISEEGRKNIGKVVGDQVIPRGKLWRR